MPSWTSQQTEPARESYSPSFLARAFLLQCANAGLHGGWHASHARHAKAIALQLILHQGASGTAAGGGVRPPPSGQGTPPSPRSPSFPRRYEPQ